MPNVMAALPNTGGVLCSTPQSLADATTRVPRTNAAKRQNLLKFAGVPQTRQQISAASGAKLTILWEHVGEKLLFNNFLPTVDTCLICENTARQICAVVPRWRFFASILRPVFPASRVQHISDVHSKFALTPHHVADIQCAAAEIRRGKKRKKKETTGWKYNGLPYSIGWP